MTRIYLIEERTRRNRSWRLADDAEPIASRKRAEQLARKWQRWAAELDEPTPGYETRAAEYRRVER